jgi:ABC-type phosphate transport system substrate-binding protein
MIAVTGKLGKHDVTFSYTPTDSSDGKSCIANGGCAFAGSDSALSLAEQMQMPSAWVLPSLAAAVAVGFNLPNFGNAELRIPRETLAAIFLGRIRQWAELAHWNANLAGLDRNISLVVRSDRSPTSRVFSSALSSFSSEWRSKVGPSSLPNWPRYDFRAEGDSGVAIQIKQTPYALGFISHADAVTFRVPAALISNDVGDFVAPKMSGVQSAMDAFAVELDEQGRKGHRMLFQSIVDPKNTSGAYPICMFTYLIFDAGGLGCDVLHDVMYLLYWAWTDPQAAAIATTHNLSPVSAAVRAALLSTLRDLDCEAASSPVSDEAHVPTDRNDTQPKFRERVLEQVADEYSPFVVGAGAALP